jgi:hypothetical protein
MEPVDGGLAKAIFQRAIAGASRDDEQRKRIAISLAIDSAR